MKACLLAMLSLVFASFSSAHLSYTREQVIAYAKSIDVQMLDPSLPSQRLEDWLQSEPVHAETVVWTMQDTCWNKPSTNEDYPLCVEVEAERKSQWGRFLLQIGTNFKGIVGPPQLNLDMGIQISEGDSYTSVAYAERLADLPLILEQPNLRIIAGVRKLYEEVVAHHPLGIPAGAEKATIWPLLSKHLAEQLQTAQSCEADYVRQQQTRDSASKPTWLKMGIFSGDGERALPTWSFAYSRGPQQDGSFQVDVELHYLPDPENSFAVHNLERRWWGAAARVIVEDGRFVVDDVRIFDRFPAEGPSHLLSGSFTGCDGPHWTGLDASKQ